MIVSELEHLRNRHGFPGVTVAYVLSDGTIGEAACGFADLETKEPMTTRSRMLAASVGKTFVAATVIALDREGRLNLDDPLTSWLGGRNWYDRLPNHDTITLRHLLTHRSGLPDHVYTKRFAQLFSERKAVPPEVLIECILDQPPLFEAGTDWAYTDTGYILLGLVIEQATGNTYYGEVEQRFLKPLKLNMTAPSDRLLLPGLVAGYTAQDSPFGLPRKTIDDSGAMVWDPAIEWTGGGLISTSHDLAVWAKLLYEGNAMPYEYMDDLLPCVVISNSEFGEKWGHGGVIPGYCSSMRYYPKYRVAIAFQVNTDAGISDFGTDMEQCLAEIIFLQ